MCLYPRLAWALLQNLVARLWGDLVDWWARARWRTRRRIRRVFSRYDDVGPIEEAVRPDVDDDESSQQLATGLENKPWFHRVDRKSAEDVVAKGGDGCYLIRPSSAYPLTLTLSYKGRPYNIAVRKRENGRIGLGSRKINERTFSNVEQLVEFYGKEELKLISDGVCAGSSKLVSTPNKKITPIVSRGKKISKCTPVIDNV